MLSKLIKTGCIVLLTSSLATPLKLNTLESGSTSVPTAGEQYKLIYDFNESSNVGKSTASVCKGDYVVEGYGCLTSELESISLKNSNPIDTTTKLENSDLLYVVDDSEFSTIAYIYIYRDDFHKTFDTITLSNSIALKDLVDGERIYDEYYKDYKLVPVSVSENGHYVKYLIKDIKVQRDSEGNSRYMVTRVYDSKSGDKLESHLQSSVNQFLMTEGKIVKTYINAINISNKYVISDIFPKSIKSTVGTKDMRQLTYVFFDTSIDKDLDERDGEIVSAKVSYKYRNYTGMMKYPKIYYNQEDQRSRFLEPLANNALKNPTSFMNFQDYTGSRYTWAGNKTDTPLFNIENENVNSTYYSESEEFEVYSKQILTDTLNVTTVEQRKSNWKEILGLTIGFTSGIIGIAASTLYVCLNPPTNTYKYDIPTIGETQNLVNDPTKVNLGEGFKNIKQRNYILFDVNDEIKGKALRVKDTRTNKNHDALSLYNYRHYTDVNTNELTIEYANGEVVDYVAMDTNTDSSGVDTSLWEENKSEEQLRRERVAAWFKKNGWWLGLSTTIIILIVVVVLIAIFAPQFLPLIARGIGCFFKMILWIPYGILVLPFQAIHCKINKKELVIWNPFR